MPVMTPLATFVIGATGKTGRRVLDRLNQRGVPTRAALTEPGHSGELYEVTGPRLLSFARETAATGVWG